MKILRSIWMLLAMVTAAFSASCDDDGTDFPPRPDGMTEVRVAAEPLSRTALGDDGLTSSWVRNDRIAMWALPSSGEAAFANVPFTFWANKADGSGGFFRGYVPAMAAGTYTYHAAYPLPAAAEGLRVSYDLPAVQDGAWHGEYDVMLASATAPQLHDASDSANDVNEIGLCFRHKLHALKITIPEGRNRFGRKVSRLRVRFPQPVAGRLTWDLSNPDAAPEMTGTSDAVTLEFPTPVGEGDTFWLFIAPADLTGGEVLFTATDGEEYAWPLASDGFGACPAGKITPVTLTIPALRPAHDFRVSLDSSQLGETVTEAGFVGPDDYVFATLSASNKSDICVPDGSGTFVLRLFDDQGMFPTTSEIVVGSKSAENVRGRLSSAQCPVKDLTDSGCTIMAPYLFFEDFSGVASFNAGDNAGSGSSATNPDAIGLDSYGLPGWTGARVGGKEGTAVRCCCHFEGAGLAYGRYDGRIDSAPISAIRPGQRVRVSVTYDYDGGTTRSGEKLSPTYAYGYTTQAGGFKGNSDIENQLESGIELSKTNNYDSIGNTNTFTIPDCSASHRLSWKVSNNKSGWTSFFGDYFLYIDNIRVTIVP